MGIKILFLISQLPYPLDTGAKIRSYNLLKSLSAKYDVTLVAFGDRKEEAGKINALEEISIKVEIVQRRTASPYLLAIKNIFSRYPYSVNKYYSRTMSKKIEGLLNREKFDLIHCDSVQVSKNVLSLKNIPKVLTEHNIESQILERTSQKEANVLKKIYFYIQYLKLKRYEIYACKQFDHVITVSEEDRKFLKKFIPEGNISVVSNGVDTGYFLPNSKSATEGIKEHSIVFTGSMDWLPNTDAVKHFCKDILPLIWKDERSLKFYIVGRNPSEDIFKLGKEDTRIIVTGSVEDVRPYMDKAELFVVPLRIGGGTRLKILEAMAMGKAVISTSVGCEGLDVTDGEDIMIADNPADFAKAVLSLLHNTSLKNKLESDGKNMARRRYDWEVVSVRLDKVWNSTFNRMELPILLYHDICDDNFDITKAAVEKRPYIINESDFEEQMRYLRDNHFKTISLKELYSEQMLAPHSNTVIISFDDGSASNYTKALPILKRYGLKAIFFVTAGMVGKEEFMNWGELKELINSGMEIGSHSLTHAIPTNLTREGMNHELIESKRVLEENLGIKVYYYSSPTGFLNPLLPAMAKKTGYKAVLISRASLNNARDMFVLNKTGVKRDYDFGKFVSIVNRDEAIFNNLRLKQKTRDGLKKILGYNVYNIARKVVLENVK